MFAFFRVLRKRILQAFRPIIITDAQFENGKVTISVLVEGTDTYTIAITIDNVTATPTNLNPRTWTVDILPSTGEQVVAWTVTATNPEGTETVSDSLAVAGVAIAPGLTSTSAVEAARTLTVQVTPTGNPPPVLTTSFTVADEAETLVEVSRGVWTFLFPGSSSTTAYSGTITATNGFGSPATYNFSGTVAANGVPLAFTAPQWTLIDVEDDPPDTAPLPFVESDWSLTFTPVAAVVPSAFTEPQWSLVQDAPNVQPPPPTGGLTAPQSVAAATQNDRTVRVSWTAPASGSPTSYDVQWAATAAGPWTTRAGVTSPHDVTPLPVGGDQYFFRVTARDGTGSVNSGNVTATTHMRPYGLTAEWNIPISQVLGRGTHPNETYIRDVIWQGRGAGPGVNYINFFNRDYTYPVYYSTDATTTATVAVAFGNWRTGQVPWNPAWVIPSGTDNQIVLLDEANGVEYNAWRIRYDAGTNRLLNAASGEGRFSRVTADLDGSGAPGDYRTKVNGFIPSRGPGIQYLALLIRPEEIAQGKIYHALGIVMHRSGFAYHSRPAYKSERSPGAVTNNMGVPQGTRLWLDVSDAEIDAHVASWPTGVPASTRNSMRIVFKAMQEYGFIANDIGGDNHIQFEHDATADWTPYGLSFFGTGNDGGNYRVNARSYPRDAIDGFISDRARLRIVRPPDGVLHYARWAGDDARPTALTGTRPDSVTMTEVGRPLISGGTSAGSVMTISRPAQFFAEHPFEITRNWQRNGVNISGATGTTYTRTSADIGASIRCRFTATNIRGATTFDSNAI